MHEFHGDLLIGGARLKSLHGELEAEEPLPAVEESHEWVLGGHLKLTPQEWESIGPNRQYRLELDDGRAAQVVITRVISRNENEVVVDFEHFDWHTSSAVHQRAKG